MSAAGAGCGAVLKQRLVLEPARAFAFERDEVAHTGHALANAVDQIEVVRMDTEHLRTAVACHIDEVVGREPVVHRHDHGAPLRDRIELLEVLVSIRCNGRDAIALADPESRERGGPPVAALAELAVRESNVAVDDGFAAAMQFSRATCELQRREWRFHE